MKVGSLHDRVQEALGQGEAHVEEALHVHQADLEKGARVEGGCLGAWLVAAVQ
ncbi:MAG: hypothetical protein QOJ35_2559 [Solirubrobacteraceae bacterium]|jgi:hypothetical protein|nr:hypothetical protein [Solirubrobacteraceae bacterium]